MWEKPVQKTSGPPVQALGVSVPVQHQNVIWQIMHLTSGLSLRNQRPRDGGAVVTVNSYFFTLWVVRFQASLCMRKPYSSQIPGIYVAAFYFCQICSFSYQIWSGLLFFQLLLGKETRSNKKQLCGLHENFTIILGVGPYCVVPIRPDHLPSPLPFLMAKISVVCLLVCFFHSLSLLPPLDHFFQEGLYIQSTYYWQKRSPWCIPTLPPPWCVKCI